MVLPMFKIVEVRYSNDPCDFCLHKTKKTSPDIGWEFECSEEAAPGGAAWRTTPCPKFFARVELPQELREKLTKTFLKRDEAIKESQPPN